MWKPERKEDKRCDGAKVGWCCLNSFLSVHLFHLISTDLSCLPKNCFWGTSMCACVCMQLQGAASKRRLWVRGLCIHGAAHCSKESVHISMRWLVKEWSALFFPQKILPCRESLFKVCVSEQKAPREMKDPGPSAGWTVGEVSLEKGFVKRG